MTTPHHRWPNQRPSGAYYDASEEFHSGTSPDGRDHSSMKPTDPRLAALFEDLLDRGFTVERHNDDKHWIPEKAGLRFNYWPGPGKWMLFGKTWKSSIAAVDGAIADGRFKMPGGMKAKACKECGVEITFLKTDSGKWCPVERDGCSHIGRCPGR